MSKFLVPNTFVPGTKAKAQDVNENFTAVQNELNLKAATVGDISQQFFVADAKEENHAVTKKQLESAKQELLGKFLVQGSVQSGYINENGDVEILSAENNVLNFNVDDGILYGPIVAVPANSGSVISVDEIESIVVSSYADGKYNVFLGLDGNAYLLKNKVYSQKVRPENVEVNSIFKDISSNPFTTEIFNGTVWVSFEDIILGSITVEKGLITSVENLPFLNRYADTPAEEVSTANQFNPAVVVENYRNGNSWYRIYSDGWCEQGGIAVGSTDAHESLTVNLLKPYIDNNWTLTYVPITNNVKTYQYDFHIGVEEKTEKSFKTAVNSSAKATLTKPWVAFGYIK